MIATGTEHTVGDLVEVAFAHVSLDWRQYVRQDPSLIRPAEVETLLGDASHARETLGWEPEVSFEELVQKMVDSDLAAHRSKLPS